jgi:hypothetical protein
VIRAIVGAVILAALGSETPAAAQRLADLMSVALHREDVSVLENEYVRVYYEILEYPKAEPRVADTRPVVLYIRVTPQPGIVNMQLLEPPPEVRPFWRPGVIPRGIRIEMLKPPPPAPALGEPGTNPPRGATEEGWNGGQLIVATFRPFDYGVGLGTFPSVTTFLSDGAIEVTSLGLRRRMYVRAGEAFWFDARTRLTVVDDYPIAAAILQLSRR